MANNLLNTRIRLKYDLYSNWYNANPILLEGEVAIAVPGTNLGSVETAASCLMKVGDGTNNFNNLPWLAAIAADVHEWAKKSESEFKSWLVSSEGPNLATNAQINLLNSSLAELQDDINTYKNEKDNHWKDAPNGNVISTTYATKQELSEKFDSLENVIGNISNVMNFIGVLDKLPTQDEELISYENGDVIIVGNKEYVFVISTDSEGNVTSKGFVEFGDTTAELALITQNTSAIADNTAKINEEIENRTNADTALAKEIKDISDSLADFEERVGTFTEDKTLVQFIADTYVLNDDYTSNIAELSNRIETNEDKLVNIGGTGQPETVVAAIAAAEQRAAANAQSKAETARDDAIKAASADATQKASVAEANANDYTDEEIGKVESSISALEGTVIKGSIDENNNLTLSLKDNTLDIVFYCGNSNV